MPEILLHVRARKFLERLDAKTRARIVRAMEKTAADPESSPNLSPLQGELSGLYRLRVGDFRVIIEFDRAADRLYVHAIGPRGDVYK